MSIRDHVSVIEDPAIFRLLRSREAVLIKAVPAGGDAADQAAFQKYGEKSLPLTVVLAPENPSKRYVVRGALGVEEMKSTIADLLD